VEGTVDEQVLSNTLFKDKNIKTIMRDAKLGLDFSQKTKEETMSMEQELKRIADALEKMVSLREKDLTAQLPGPAPAVEPKKAVVEPKKIVAEPKKIVAEPTVQLTSEEYQKKMQDAANKISASSGDPAKTNILFAKLQAEFKKLFPNNEHVFDVEEKDYAKVCAIVNGFLKKEKIL
jgi:hypothetical protein